jgi:hypothetical protein
MAASHPLGRLARATYRRCVRASEADLGAEGANVNHQCAHVVCPSTRAPGMSLRASERESERATGQPTAAEERPRHACGLLRLSKTWLTARESEGEKEGGREGEKEGEREGSRRREGRRRRGRRREAIGRAIIMDATAAALGADAAAMPLDLDSFRQQWQREVRATHTHTHARTRGHMPSRSLGRCVCAQLRLRQGNEPQPSDTLQEVSAGRLLSNPSPFAMPSRELR